jgi:hypothetical protein
MFLLFAFLLAYLDQLKYQLLFFELFEPYYNCDDQNREENDAVNQQTYASKLEKLNRVNIQQLETKTAYRILRKDDKQRE